MSGVLNKKGLYLAWDGGSVCIIKGILVSVDGKRQNIRSIPYLVVNIWLFQRVFNSIPPTLYIICLEQFLRCVGIVVLSLMVLVFGGTLFHYARRRWPVQVGLARTPSFLRLGTGGQDNTAPLIGGIE